MGPLLRGEEYGAESGRHTNRGLDHRILAELTLEKIFRQKPGVCYDRRKRVLGCLTRAAFPPVITGAGLWLMLRRAQAKMPGGREQGQP